MENEAPGSTVELRMIAATSMLLTGLFGFALNLLISNTLFNRFRMNSGFLMICMMKSMANNVVCVGVCLWPVPITYLNYYFLPSQYNVLAGQIIGWFAWSYGPTTQILLAGNRLAAVYFPHEYHAKYRIPPNRIFLSIIFLLSCVLSVPGFFDGCNFIYSLENLSWLPEFEPCSLRLSAFFTYFAFSMSAISNTFNIIVFFKLLADAKIAKISSAEHLNRQRRNRRMLFQSCCQDCIAAIDTFNTTYAWRFYSSLWFKFLVCAYSRVLARTLEGVVMVTINETIRDSIHKRIFNGAKKRNSSTPAGSITIMSHSKTIIAANRFQNLRLNH